MNGNRYRGFSSLGPWLNGQESLGSFVNGSRLFLDKEFGGWISLEKVVEAHLCYEVDGQSLEETWKDTDKYVEDALKIIHTANDELPEDTLIDGEDRRNIIFKLGEPPAPCYPLYIFSVGDGDDEEIVYIGLTNSSASRFSSGHRACIKLLDPLYNNKRKRLYLCHVMLISKNDGYLPLEWVKPYMVAKQLLDDFESQLIFHYQPRFNEKKKQNYCAKNSHILRIVNYTGQTSFLNGEEV